MFRSSASNLQDEIHIDHSTFNHVHGDWNHYQIAGDIYTDDGERGLLALSKAASLDALHDASARFPPPKCHPETRTEVRSILMSWIKDPSPIAYIIWMYGPAGAGKSSIAQTIAEWCRKFNSHLAGTFFFLRGQAGREAGSRLFCTLAYQLALYVPGLREHVNRAMRIDPALPNKDLDTQFRTLIIEPFQRLSSPPKDLPFVIIDGLDECQGFETQKHILKLIGEALEKYKLPLRFLIASRPEPHIREIFDTSLLNQKTRRIILDGSFHPDRDIRLFLEDGFSEIAKRHQELMANIELPWPSPSVIDFLVQKSSGQFIYAATVLKFVDAELHIPTVQLEMVLQPPPVRSTLFSSLDQLYTQVLKVCPYPETLTRIFALMLVLHCPQPIAVYEDILDLPPGHVSYILRGVHSLVRFPGDMDDTQERISLNQREKYDHTCGLRLHHASFRDFLLDHSRSDQFFVDSTLAHAQVIQSASDLFLGCIDSSWSKERRGRVPSLGTWGYFKHHFAIHFYQCPESERRNVMDGLQRFHDEFKFSVIYGTPEDLNNLAFESLHALLTALVKTEFYATPQEPHSSWPNLPLATHPDYTMDVAIDHFNFQVTNSLCEKYSRLLDQFYHLALSASNAFTRLLEYLPGFLTWTFPIALDWLEDIYGVSNDMLLPCLEKNAPFIRRWIPVSEACKPIEVLCVNPHFSNFLFRQKEAGSHYQDPWTQDRVAFHHLISLIFHSNWVQGVRQSEALECIDKMFKLYLDAANPGCQLMMDSLQSLETIIYDIPALVNAPVPNVDLVWSATCKILNWTQKRRQTIAKRERDWEQRSLDSRLAWINRRIFQQILRLDTFHGKDGSSRRITLCEPLERVAASLWPTSEDVPADLPRRIPETTGFESDLDSVGLSKTLFSLRVADASLAEFLTHPEYAGDLYISPDAYHTQFAEVCLYHCDLASRSKKTRPGDWPPGFNPAYTTWKFFLLRAQGTPRLLARLLDIPVGLWLAEASLNETRGKRRAMKDILGWLERLSPTPTAIIERWQAEITAMEKLPLRMGDLNSASRSLDPLWYLDFIRKTSL